MGKVSFDLVSDKRNQKKNNTKRMEERVYGVLWRGFTNLWFVKGTHKRGLGKGVISRGNETLVTKATKSANTPNSIGVYGGLPFQVKVSELRDKVN